MSSGKAKLKKTDANTEDIVKDIPVVEPPKKRGRKPKVKFADEEVVSPSEKKVVTHDAEDQDVTTAPKTIGRKTKKSVFAKKAKETEDNINILQCDEASITQCGDNSENGVKKGGPNQAVMTDEHVIVKLNIPFGDEDKYEDRREDNYINKDVPMAYNKDSYHNMQRFDGDKAEDVEHGIQANGDVKTNLGNSRGDGGMEYYHGYHNNYENEVMNGSSMRPQPHQPNIYSDINGNPFTEGDKMDMNRNYISDDISKLRVVSILGDFEEKNRNKEWPANTNTSCYWCCHQFHTPPVGIPVGIKDGSFQVFGCFCGLECASAYNFSSTNAIDDVWERNNLLTLMARKMGIRSVIKPAPNRLSLKMFGGFLNIEQFRNYHNTSKVIHVNFPPMTSITQQIEEINEYELNQNLKYIPMDSERLNHCKDRLFLKRLKPTISKDKTTIETTMNLKYRTTPQPK